MNKIRAVNDVEINIYCPRNFSMTLSYNYFTYAKHEYADKSGELSMTPLPDTIVSVPIGIISKKVISMLHSHLCLIRSRITIAHLKPQISTLFLSS